jgi:ABC-type phosphate/phosphonate transport system permease subunit
MWIYWRTALAVIVAFTLGMFLLRAMRPVGWFDLVVTLVLSVVAFLFVRYFKGFTSGAKFE